MLKKCLLILISMAFLPALAGEVENAINKGNSQTIKTLIQVAELTGAESSLDNQKIIVEIDDDWTMELVNKIILAKQVEGKCNITPVRVNKILGQPSENIKPTPVQPTNKKPDVIYQVYANNKWYPNVTNLTDYAGVENKSVQCVYANLSQGSIKYRVHVLGGGWLPWVTDRTDYAGIYGKNIDAIQFDSNYKIKYRVSTVGSTSYLPWVINTADYAGIFGKKIDKLQIIVE